MPKAKAQKAVLSAKLHQTSQKYATEATADLSTDSFKDLRTKIESQFKKLDQKGAGTNKGAAKKPEPSSREGFLFCHSKTFKSNQGDWVWNWLFCFELNTAKVLMIPNSNSSILVKSKLSIFCDAF